MALSSIEIHRNQYISVDIHGWRWGRHMSLAEEENILAINQDRDSCAIIGAILYDGAPSK